MNKEYKTFICSKKMFDALKTYAVFNGGFHPIEHNLYYMGHLSFTSHKGDLLYRMFYKQQKGETK